jgi:hypothetical protein
MDSQTLIIAGVGIPALIIALIQFSKRFWPAAGSRVWLGASFALALAFWVVAYWADNGAPATLKDGLALVVLALNFGLSAAAAYDRSSIGAGKAAAGK